MGVCCSTYQTDNKGKDYEQTGFSWIDTPSTSSASEKQVSSNDDNFDKKSLSSTPSSPQQNREEQLDDKQWLSLSKENLCSDFALRFSGVKEAMNGDPASDTYERWFEGINRDGIRKSNETSSGPVATSTAGTTDDSCTVDSVRQANKRPNTAINRKGKGTFRQSPDKPAHGRQRETSKEPSDVLEEPKRQRFEPSTRTLDTGANDVNQRVVSQKRTKEAETKKRDELTEQTITAINERGPRKHQDTHRKRKEIEHQTKKQQRLETSHDLTLQKSLREGPKQQGPHDSSKQQVLYERPRQQGRDEVTKQQGLCEGPKQQSLLDDPKQQGLRQATKQQGLSEGTKQQGLSEGTKQQGLSEGTKQQGLSEGTKQQGQFDGSKQKKDRWDDPAHVTTDTLKNEQHQNKRTHQSSKGVQKRNKDSAKDPANEIECNVERKSQTQHSTAPNAAGKSRKQPQKHVLRNEPRTTKDKARLQNNAALSNITTQYEIQKDNGGQNNVETFDHEETKDIPNIYIESPIVKYSHNYAEHNGNHRQRLDVYEGVQVAIESLDSGDEDKDAFLQPSQFKRKQHNKEKFEIEDAMYCSPGPSRLDKHNLRGSLENHSGDDGQPLKPTDSSTSNKRQGFKEKSSNRKKDKQNLPKRWLQPRSGGDHKNIPEYHSSDFKTDKDNAEDPSAAHSKTRRLSIKDRLKTITRKMHKQSSREAPYIVTDDDYEQMAYQTVPRTNVKKIHQVPSKTPVIEWKQETVSDDSIDDVSQSDEDDDKEVVQKFTNLSDHVKGTKGRKEYDTSESHYASIVTRSFGGSTTGKNNRDKSTWRGTNNVTTKSKSTQNKQSNHKGKVVKASGNLRVREKEGESIESTHNIYKATSKQGKTLKIYSYNSLGDVISSEITVPDEVMAALDSLTAVSSSLDSSDDSTSTLENECEDGTSVRHDVDNAVCYRRILGHVEDAIQDVQKDEETRTEDEEDWDNDDDDDDSGSYFNLSKKLNRLCKKYEVRPLYDINKHENKTIPPNRKRSDGHMNEFDDDFDVIEEDDEVLHPSGITNDTDIYRIDSWLKSLKAKPAWKSQIHESYFDVNDDFNTKYDINDEKELPQSPSPVGSYFDMQDEIDSRMELLRQENSSSYVKLEEICSCCVYDLQERINKCMYVKPMAPVRIPRPPPPPPLTYKSKNYGNITPPPTSATTVIYPTQYGNDDDQDIFTLSLSSSTLKSSIKDGYTDEDDDISSTPTASQSGSYFDIREQFDNCMEILRLEESLSFIGINEDTSASSV